VGDRDEAVGLTAERVDSAAGEIGGFTEGRDVVSEEADPGILIGEGVIERVFRSPPKIRCSAPTLLASLVSPKSEGSGASQGDR
jgi:hypothetical protein